MAPHEIHINDDELLLSAEGELSPSRQQSVEIHLKVCSACRERLSTLHRSLDKFAAIHRAEIGSVVPKPDAIDALSREAVHKAPLRIVPPSHRRSLSLRSVALGSVAAAILVFVWVRDYRNRPQIAEATVQQAEFGSLPDTRFTPGAVNTEDATAVCQLRPAPRPNISPAVTDEVLRDYHAGAVQPQNFELDYLITPELGGATDPRNLWPEPYANTEWNAHVKDQLEDRLRELVCDGKLDLPTAQHEIASNWISAYRKYFHSQEPLPAVTARSEKGLTQTE